MRKKGYLFWDSETANSQQRICQVAFILTDLDGNRIQNQMCRTINPESEVCWWSRKNLDIDWDSLPTMPTFAQFCEEVGLLDLLRDYIFVAHNANGADIHHIKKSMAANGVEMPAIDAVDTMLVAQQHGLPGSLKRLCSHFGITLNAHHDAFCDVEACYSIFKKLSEEFGVPEALKWSFSSDSNVRTKRVFYGLGLVHGSQETIEDVLKKAEMKGLRGDANEIENPVGLRVIVSGETPGYKREQILVALKTCGMKATEGKPAKKTQYLAIGDNAGQVKLDAVFGGSSPAKIVTTGELLEVMNRFGKAQ